MLRIFILIFISYLSIYSSCNKRINCNATVYSFEATIRAFPDSDSLNMGDTIWLELICPARLRDAISGNMIDYSGAENFGTVIGCLEFTGGDILNPGVVGAANDFDFKIIYGSLVSNPINPGTNKEFLFSEIQSTYKFKLGLIPKKTGIFAVSPGNAANVYRRNNSCDKAGFSITFTNTAQHLYFYEQNRPGYTPSEYERTHMYCFKVK